MPWWWPVHLVRTLLVLAWLERVPLHLVCRVFACAWVAGVCRRFGRIVSMVRDFRLTTPGDGR